MAGAQAFLKGDAELAAALAKMLAETEDLRAIWPLYHDAFKTAEAGYFASQGDGKWAALKPAYARWKAKHGGGGHILELTGKLRQSLAGEGSYHIFDSEPRYMRAGSKDPVANIHFSKKRREKRMPLDVRSAEMQSEMHKAVVQHAEAYARMWTGGSP